MYQSSLWPSITGVTVITEKSQDDYYIIPRGQFVVFPFELINQDQIRIDAGHTTFYDNQQGTISAWASDEIIGRSITGDYNSNLSRVKLYGDGFSWLFHDLNKTPYEETRHKPLNLSPFDFNPFNPTSPKLTHWIYPNKTYFMCFQNLENKDNGLFARFTYMTR